MRCCLTLLLFLSVCAQVFADPRETVQSSGVPGGLVVCVGDDFDVLDVEVDLGESFVVQYLDEDAEHVQRMRAQLLASGTPGRISAATFDGTRLPYVDDMVNLLIVPSDVDGLSREEMLRVLAPNGKAIVGGETLVKAWPSDIDSWPHWLHGPDNNAVSTDTRVGISRSLQWVMPPKWGRHHNLLYSVNALISENGRLYYIMDEAPIGIRSTADQWVLGCRDAFNGTELWKRPISNWGWSKWSEIEVDGTMRFRGPDQLFRRLVASGDTVYVTLGFNEPVVAIDGRTGQVLKTFEGTENTATIQLADGMLYLTRNVLDPKPGKSILAVDAKSGDILWERTGYAGVTPHGNELGNFTDAHLTVGDTRLFFVDDESVLAIDRATGEDVWSVPRPSGTDQAGHYDFNFRDYCTLVYTDGRLLLGQIYPDPRNLNAWQQKDMHIWSLDAATGEKQWEHLGMSLAHFTPPDLFVVDGLAWTMRKDVVSLVGLDLATGDVAREHPVKDMLVGHHHRCYRNKATVNHYLAGEEGIEYIDFEDGSLDVHHFLRGACSYGIMPANGMIYLPAHACGCHGNAKLEGFIALSSRPETPAVLTPEEDRLVQGAGLASAASLQDLASPGDWPTYKHDNHRSNAATSSAPSELDEQWSVALGDELTAPIIVNGRVYVASGDRGAVYCLDAESGEIAWTFASDGRIDSPPTYSNGRVLFGTRAGSVYALTADSGELLWRYQAAPSTDRIMAHGQPESLWPVHGAILVQDGKAFCTAGRSMNLDSGLYAYVLDVKTGEVLQRAQYSADQEVKGETKDSVVSGLLVGDDEGLFMRGLKIDPSDITQVASGGSPGTLTPRSGGLLDSSWYNSGFWEYLKTKAQMLTFDDETIVGVAAYKKQTPKSYGHDVATVGAGYTLFAMKPSGGKNAPEQAWKQQLPVRAEAILLTDDAVCAAGAPDVADPSDPWGAFENRKGGVLLVLNKENGSLVDEAELGSAPVYDGMAAANGKLFLSLKDGRVVCY